MADFQATPTHPRFQDLTGRRFNRLVVLGYLGCPRRNRPHWLCKCDCGHEKSIDRSSLVSGDTKSCGCLRVEMATGVDDLTGMRFGRLVAIRYFGRLGTKQNQWLCLCDCGTEKPVLSASLRQGNTKSCGCLNIESIRTRSIIHGGTGTPEHNVWRKMLGRCYTPSTDHFERYGGRGIYVCDGWREDFAAFLTDVGNRPSATHSIDRIENDGSYTCGHCDQCRERGAPANVRWATKAQQMRNRMNTRMLTHLGKTQAMVDWSKELGISMPVLFYRLKRGWSEEKTLSTPLQIQKH